MGAIYKITNNTNNKVYVGYTMRTAEERVGEHLNYWNTKRCNKHLRNAIRKDKLENFSYEILVEGEYVEEALIEFEKHFIWLYNAWRRDFGYNKTKGGKLPPSKEEKEKERELYKNHDSLYKIPTSSKKRSAKAQENWKKSWYDRGISKPVLILNSNLEIIQEFNTPQEAAKYFNLNSSSVYVYLSNVNKTCRNHVIVYKDNLESKLEQIKNDLNYFEAKRTIRIKITNTENNIETIFKSIPECLVFLNTSKTNFYRILKKKIFKNYIVQTY